MKVAEKARTPTEGEWFVVNINTINKNLFKREKKDPQQESTRQIIREAFYVVKNNPKKYPEVFKVLMPEKTWRKKSVSQFKKLACEFGDHAADWVEQALVWAQRISNGESWKTVCNDPDTANWYRLIAWDGNYWRLVGGSQKLKDETPSSSVYHYNYWGRMHIQNAIPLVVSYE